VRDLIVRTTAIAAAGAALLSGFLTAASHAPWFLIFLRAFVAFALVAAVGFGFGAILMRTALRRHYEQARAGHVDRRERQNR